MAKFTSAVILAAGNGTRFGGKVKKQYVEILGTLGLKNCVCGYGYYLIVCHLQVISAHNF